MDLSVWKAGVMVLLLNIVTHGVNFMLDQPRAELVVYLTTEGHVT